MNKKVMAGLFAGLLTLAAHAGDANLAPSAAWRGFTEAGQRAYTEGRYDEAADYFRRAMREVSEYGGSGRALAVSLNNLTLVLVTQGRYAAAEPLQRRSVAMVEQQLGEDHPDVAVGLVNLARILIAQRKFDEAAPLLDRALAIRRSRFGPEHASVASIHASIGQMKAVQGLHAEAEGEFQRALQMTEKALGSRHASLVPILESYGQTLDALARPQEAVRLRDRAAAIRNQVR